MAVTKTTTTSYGTRVKNSFGGIGTGIVMFLLGTALLWWNEGRAVKTAKALEEAQGNAIHVENVDEVDPSLNGQLIHATAQTKVEDTLNDPEFGFSAQVIKIDRDVEYYQYEEYTESETKDKLGGSQETTTTYLYRKAWRSQPVNSEEFEDPAYRGKNMTLMNFEDYSATAENVTFGGYRLNASQIAGLTGYTPVKLDIEDSNLKAWNNEIANMLEGTAAKLVEENAQLAASLEEAADSTASDSAAAPVEINDNRYKYVHVSNNVVYFGKNPSSPQIGDVRVTLRQVKPGLASVLAVVNGDTFESYIAKNGNTVSMIRTGNVSMERMFKQAEETNTVWLWVCRIIGIMIVCGGLKGVFNILSTILKVVPFLASIMNWGVNLICNIIGIAWSLLVIAIAWLFYRPLLAIGILAVIAAIVGFFVYRGKQKKAEAAEVPAE